ncbi:MAG: Crp/Fnr family transcriptional regulator [Planctomycetes bacterium]|nr:Crp/Fnr family transcriptional regulator [Planctomycetota bacterium]
MRMAAIQDVEKLRFFRDLPEKARERVAGISTLRKYDAGEVIFREGEPTSRLCVLAKGFVSFRQSQKGSKNEVTIGTLADFGEVFGISALIGHTSAYTLTANCVEATEVYEIEGTRLFDLCEENPTEGVAILRALTVIMADRLTGAREQIRSRLLPGLISHG